MFAEHLLTACGGQRDDIVTCKWMFGDSGISQALAEANPMRWSNFISIETAIAELQHELTYSEVQGGRPIVLRVTFDGTSTDEVRFETTEKAISHIQKLDVETFKMPKGDVIATRSELPPRSISSVTARQEESMTVVDLFLQHAGITYASFCVIMRDVAHFDLVASPFGKHVFSAACCGDEHSMMKLDTLQTILARLAAAKHIFQKTTSGKGVSPSDFGPMLKMILSKVIDMDPAWEPHLRFLTTPEAFSRWDTDDSGLIDEGEWCALCLTAYIIIDAFKSALKPDQKELDREQFGLALQQLGFGNIRRVFQGQLVDGVFNRMDGDGTGQISMPEFAMGAVRLMRPVLWTTELRNAAGWPGWRCLLEPQIDKLAEKINTLQTGDLILFKLEDSLAWFLGYSMDTPWSHIGIVVRRTPIGGVANLDTEELLQRYPFRRASHKFCAPGYCRCFDDSPAGKQFPLSTVQGCGEVSILESTGEGIHLYDLAYRVFESPDFVKRMSRLAVRRLVNAPQRDDPELVSGFIKRVRGSLYSTIKDELHDSVVGHQTDSSPKTDSQTELQHSGAQKQDGDSYFCSKLVAEFYQHMGWMGKDRRPNTVMPGDFDEMRDSMSRYKLPVTLAEGAGSFGPLEMIWSSELKAALPLKKPAKA